MNIFINLFENKISLYGKNSKKEEFTYDFVWDKKVENNEDILAMVADFMQTEESKVLQKEIRNVLILPDSLIGYAYFEFPHFSKFKMKDIFNTRFKSSFPNFTDFYASYYEYERTSSKVSVIYTMAKIALIDNIRSVFKTYQVNIHSLTFFASALFEDGNKKNLIPSIRVKVGSYRSEIVIMKGPTIVNIITIPYGKDYILDGGKYVYSPYQSHDSRVMKYISFIEKNYMIQTPVTDDNINADESTEEDFFSKPRELRILKDQPLEHYNLKNSARKFYSLVSDVIDTYSQAPYFLMFGDVKLDSDEEFFRYFTAIIQSYSEYTFVKEPKEEKKVFVEMVKNNSLFGKALKEERRKFDWSKFLSLEIGGRKRKD